MLPANIKGVTMAAKKLWLTWLPAGEGGAGPQEAVAGLSKAGFQVAGAPWQDDLEKMAWTELGGLLIDPANADVWLVAGTRADFDAERVRYGLSLVAAMVRAERAPPPTMIAAGLDGPVAGDGLPAMLATFTQVDASVAGWPAKVVAQAFKPAPALADAFRLNVIAHSAVGQWFEVGPAEGAWDGAMLGFTGDGCEITHHAVGPRGQLPERTVLEYPTCGIKAEIGQEAYEIWSVKNQVGADQSYYVKITGYPRKLIFGGHPGAQDGEVHVLSLS